MNYKIIKKISILIIILVSISMLGCLSKDYRTPIDQFRQAQHPLREISFDNEDIMDTVVVERWNVALVAGGEKSIAYVDKQNVVNFVYGNVEDGEMVYRKISVNMDQTEIVTIQNNTEPYIRFIDGRCEINNNQCSEHPYGEFGEKTWYINHIRFYLPEGWKLLKKDLKGE